MTRFRPFLAIVALAIGSPLVAQQATPAFDVASIKARSANDTSALRFPSFEPGGRFVMVNAPVTALMPLLYPSPSGRIEGRPSWLGTDGFDITAKAEGEPSREQMLEMLRTLVKERFKLAVHYETREEDTFALVRTSSERVGPQLRALDVDCTARAAAARAGNPVPPLPPAANGIPACRTLNASGALTSGGMSLSELATALSGWARRPVFDKTGLPGHYEVTLKYFDGPPEQRGINDQVDLFTAVREQLGLRLEPQRNPVQVLVIDHIERPTPD